MLSTCKHAHFLRSQNVYILKLRLPQLFRGQCWTLKSPRECWLFNTINCSLSNKKVILSPHNKKAPNKCLRKSLLKAIQRSGECKNADFNSPFNNAHKEEFLRRQMPHTGGLYCHTSQCVMKRKILRSSPKVSVYIKITICHQIEISNQTNILTYCWACDQVPEIQMQTHKSHI